MKVSVKMKDYEPVRVTLEQSLSLRGGIIRRDVPIPEGERGGRLSNFLLNEVRGFQNHVRELRSARYNQVPEGPNG